MCGRESRVTAFPNVRKRKRGFGPTHSRPLPAATTVASSLGSHNLAQVKAQFIIHICLTSNGGVSNGRQTRWLIALQALLTRTAVTVLHSGTMHQHPTPTLTASSHPLCTPSERRCGVVQRSPLNGGAALEGVASKRSIETITISRVIIVDKPRQRVWRLLTTLTAPQLYPRFRLVTT